MEYLQKRANSWYVRLAIPSDLLVQLAPKKELVRSMKSTFLQKRHGDNAWNADLERESELFDEWMDSKRDDW
jgi:hypothetical protein